MNREALKEEARKHEQNEDWAKALTLYMQAIDAQAEGEEPDIALHNRVGDLQIRVGDVEGAVASYERAIELYLEAELPNNAIAVCRKISRNDPRRPTPFLRMGQIRAAQGFVVDARQNFLTYAEMMQGRGKTDEALRALEEFVGLVKDDVETRVFLAEQLVVRERVEEAVKYFAQAVRTLMRKKDTEGAKKLAARIEEIAPGHPIPSGEPEEEPVAKAPADDGFGFETTSLGMEEEPAPPAAESAQDFGFSEIALGEPAAAEEESEEGEAAAPLPGFDQAGDVGGLDLAPPTGEEPADAEEAAAGSDFGEVGGDLPLMSFDDDEAAATDLPPLDLPTLEPGGAFGAEEEAASELPTFDTGGPVELEMGDFGAAEAPAADGPEPAPDDAEGWKRLGERRLAAGDEAGARAALDRAQAAFAARRDHRSAIGVMRILVDRDPGNLYLRRRAVELAYETNDRGILLESFLQLAQALEKEGSELKAEAVYRQVLGLDPKHAAANAAIARLSGGGAAPTAPPAAPKAGDADYVDLGSLVLEGGEEKTTRWVVSAGAPSGDEQADFAKMLTQFKDKVAQNLSSEDARSHYDLGTAYKEMGLMDEAIEEFQRALRAEPTNLATFEMLGQCFLDKGEPQAAIRTLDRALKLPTQVEDDLLGIYYFTARARESLGEIELAREFYEKIFSLDINFKDVTERLRTLR